MLLIQNGILHTMENNQSFCGDLLEKDGKIAQIARHITPTQDMQVIDAYGKNIFSWLYRCTQPLLVSQKKKWELRGMTVTNPPIR